MLLETYWFLPQSRADNRTLNITHAVTGCYSRGRVCAQGEFTWANFLFFMASWLLCFLWPLIHCGEEREEVTWKLRVIQLETSCALVYYSLELHSGSFGLV